MFNYHVYEHSVVYSLNKHLLESRLPGLGSIVEDSLRSQWHVCPGQVREIHGEIHGETRGFFLHLLTGLYQSQWIQMGFNMV